MQGASKSQIETLKKMLKERGLWDQERCKTYYGDRHLVVHVRRVGRRERRAVPRVHGGALSRRKSALTASFVAGSSQRPDWARCTPGGLTGVIPHGVLPPRMLAQGVL